ncbi:MAG TPA: hypothetical protein VFY28_00455 [Candidatus Paceibacterota bacterium]|nr:hypothetical protein [Candidatus Paceibacterota bacterium]
MLNRLLPKRKRTIVLIDISSASVRGAYAHIEEGKPPTLYYTAYIPIEAGGGQSSESADPAVADMLHALEQLATRLVREGGPVLRAELGSAEVNGVFVSVGAPWQETSVRVESFRKQKPFVFTKAHLEEASKRNDASLAGRIESGEAVIGIMLNGYETAKPFGKRVSRADLVILSSSLAADAARSIERTLRKTYHAHHLRMTAFAPVAYEILRDLYPHQRDFLILDVAGTATDIAFVKAGMLVDVQSIDLGVHDLLRAARSSGIGGVGMAGIRDSDRIIDPVRNAQFASRMTEVQSAWIGNLKTALVDFGQRHPLPRKLFLLADGDARDFLRRLLDTDSLRSLWLTDEPLRIIPVLAEQFTSSVVSRGTASGDAYIAMLALYYARRVAHLEEPKEAEAVPPSAAQ